MGEGVVSVHKAEPHVHHSQDGGAQRLAAGAHLEDLAALHRALHHLQRGKSLVVLCWSVMVSCSEFGFHAVVSRCYCSLYALS